MGGVAWEFGFQALLKRGPSCDQRLIATGILISSYRKLKRVGKTALDAIRVRVGRNGG